MDKNVLKRFAIESRKHLHEKVADRYALYYLDEEFDEVEKNELYTLTNEKHNLVLTKEQYEHRQKLLKKKDRYGKEHVIEEAAFTWFNRFMCLRYMEIHNFLPLGKNNESLDIRVLSSRDGNKEPEILKRNNLANNSLDINVDIDKLEKIADINDKYEKVLLKVCEKMGKVLPQIFDGETDYIELLMPKNQLNVDSFLDKLLKEVHEDNFNDIEVIGWLYQYYNDSQFENVRNKNGLIKKEELPYVTQFYTPDWIVQYMVNNTLGSFWIKSTGDESLESEFKYFIKDNIEINVGANPMLPENITFIDPCMGSGHILVYAFEVFMKLYISAGYNKKDIPELILKNNLYGLDIDDRAGQFAIISVMLKAREYDSEIFNKIDFNSLNILSIPESNPELRQYANDIIDKEVREIVDYLIDTFENGKEIGSLLIVEEKDYDKVTEYFEQATPNLFNKLLDDGLRDIIRVAKILCNIFDIAATNPPYLGIKKMSKGLIKYIENNMFYDYKYDLYACFVIRLLMMVKTGKIGMLTQQTLLNVDGYEKLRRVIVDNRKICSIVHLGSNAIDGGMGTISFVLSNKVDCNDFCTIKLNQYDTTDKKIEEFMNEKNKYIKSFDQIKIMPKYLISYDANNKLLNLFNLKSTIKDISSVKSGLSTSDNNRFIRLWYEVNIKKVCMSKTEEHKKWFKHSKGGGYRKWYGNYEYVVNWENNGEEIIQYAKELYTSYTRNVKNIKYYFCKGLSWTMTAFSAKFSLRVLPEEFLFNVESPALFDNKYEKYVFGLLNSTVGNELLRLIRDDIHYKTKDIEKVPFIYNKTYETTIDEKVDFCVKNSKYDWDSFETSWDFKKHPLV